MIQLPAPATEKALGGVAGAGCQPGLQQPPKEPESSERRHPVRPHCCHREVAVSDMDFSVQGNPGARRRGNNFQIADSAAASTTVQQAGWSREQPLLCFESLRLVGDIFASNQGAFLTEQPKATLCCSVTAEDHCS